MKNEYGRGGDRRRDNENRASRGDRPYGGASRGDRDGAKRYDGRRPGDGEKNHGDRETYGGNHMRGAGRRTYPVGGNAPRVGRVAADVPRAMRMTGDRPPRNGGFQKRGFNSAAHREADGPRPYYKENPRLEYEAPEIPADLAPEFDEVESDVENLLVGRNPIREALKAGRPVEKLLVAEGDLSGAARDIVKLARQANVVVQYVDRTRLDQIYPAHQGMLAYVAAVPYVQVEDILAAAREKGEDPFILLLDGITDPHNLGAIIRSAECAGAHGVILPERRAAGLGPAATKAAAGALNHMPIARVKNLNRTIEQLQAENIWVIGTAMNGENALNADLTGPLALVIGSEGDGISRLTMEKCDRTISLPMKGHIESLNASVAAGILMYEVVRARAK